MLDPFWSGQRVHAPAHSAWTFAEVLRLRFVRWLVLRRRLHEGESDGQMVDFRRFHHVYAPGDWPRWWSVSDARQHEKERPKP